MYPIVICAETLESRLLFNLPMPGLQFQVQDEASRQSSPSVGSDAAGNFVVVWDSFASSIIGGDIFARRFDATGQPLGPRFPVNTDPAGEEFGARVAMNDAGEFAVVWQKNNGEFDVVCVRKYYASGAPMGDEFEVSMGSAPRVMPDVAINDAGEFVVTWIGGNILWARKFAADATPLTGDIQVTTTSNGVHFMPQVALSTAGSFVVTWIRWANPPTGTGIFARLFEVDGQAVGGEIPVDPRAPGDIRLMPPAQPVGIDMDAAGNFVIVWGTTLANGGALARRFNAAGQPQGATFPVAPPFFANQPDTVAVAMRDNGEFIVSWSTSDVFAREFDASGAALTDWFIANTDITDRLDWFTDVAASDGEQYVFVWHRSLGTIDDECDVYVRLFNAVPDLTPPQASGGAFHFQTSQHISVTFSEDVAANLDLDDIEVRNVTTNQVVPPDQMQLTYDGATNTASITFPTSILANGNYSARFFGAGIHDASGNPMVGDHVIPFFVLAGDADHDRDVDVNDLGILSSNWQRVGRDFSKGDFNYSGSVDVADLGILASNWQAQLPPLTARRSGSGKAAPIELTGLS